MSEQVSYAYHAHMTLRSVMSDASPAYYYVQSMTYDASGRVDVRSLGASDLASNPVQKTDYGYFAWNTLNGLGRLKRIRTGTSTTPASLQDLRYYTGVDTSAYDANGNLLNIYDYKAGNPQAHSFGYNALNRLTSAQAGGGTGGTYGPEYYSYDANTGKLSSKAGVGYTYNAQVSGCQGGGRTIAHAVSAAGGNGCGDQSSKQRYNGS